MHISHEFELIITEENCDMRLDKALSLHPEIESRSQASRFVDWGLVSFKGVVVKSSRHTTLGEVYDVKFPIKEIKELIPYDFKLKILFEDQDVIVVDKPHGLVVHPAAGHHNDTLVNALLHPSNITSNKNSAELSSGFEANRPGLVHRLDKDTSGVLVIAKNDFSHRKLALQFKNKTVHRIYWAVCYGVFQEANGRLESHLKRHPTNRLKYISERKNIDGAPTGKLAITDYKVIGENPIGANSGVSLVELKLQTGRTHQIRVHLSEVGHGILGDPIYGQARSLKGLPSPTRLMLHARSLGFVHPKSGEDLNFLSTGLDDAFDPKVFGLKTPPEAKDKTNK